MSKIIYKNGRFLLKDGQRYYWYLGNCCVEKGIVKGFDIDSFQYEKSIDLNGDIVIPSFFNTHVHLGESIFKNISGHWTLEKYLNYTNEYNNSLDSSQREQKWMEGALYTINQMIKHGCSAICSARSRIAQEYGLKVLSGYPVMATKKLESFFFNGIEGYRKFRKVNNDKEVLSGLFIHSLYQIECEHLRLSREIQKEGVDFLTIHISETDNSRKREIDKFGKSPIETLIENRLLTPTTILVHCNHLKGYEFEYIEENKAAISICPISNLFLGEKPINPMFLNEYGIDWYISTDGVATGRTFSILEQLKSISKLYPSISCTNLFESVTITPAKKFPINNYSGEIKVGSAADFIIIAQNNLLNYNDFFKWLIKDTPVIKDLIVNGISLKAIERR